MSNRRRIELRSDALVAARRFAAALVANGEDMSSAERVVVTRALHHQLVLAFRELGIIDLSRVTENLRPTDTQDAPSR